MNLKDLVGEHLLDGVDMFDEKVAQEFGGEDCQMMRFRLDGIIYLAIEDPADGYRSSMKDIVISDTPMKSTFKSQKVIGRHRTKSKYGGEDDVLELIDVHTGNIVLEVGTIQVDDYYPSFVASFHPENFGEGNS